MREHVASHRLPVDFRALFLAECPHHLVGEWLCQIGQRAALVGLNIDFHRHAGNELAVAELQQIRRLDGGEIVGPPGSAVGCRGRGSGTRSTLTERLPCQVTAFI